MIVDRLLDWLEDALVWLSEVFPQWDVPAFLDNWGLVTQNLGAMNYFLPISEVFTLVLSVFYVLPFFLGTSLILWIVSFIRGGSSRA